MNASKILVIISAVIYSVAIIFYFIKSTKSISKYFGFAGMAVNVAEVILNWVLNGYVPFVSMYQVLSFLGVCFPLAYVYINRMLKTDVPFVVFNALSFVAMIGSSFMDSSLMKRAPSLNSPYFFPHILCYMIGYSLSAVGFILTVMIMVKQKSNNEESKKIEEITYKVLITAFPFMVAGMFLGALWANACWGNYWAWDPKETWALITTCLYALYFHIRKHKDLKKFVCCILILAFLSLLMTLFGVNLFKLNAMHSYS